MFSWGDNKHLVLNVLQVIQALILSHLDYCSAIWSSAANKELYKLQLVQNRAARLALQCSIRKSTDQMHAYLA